MDGNFVAFNFASFTPDLPPADRQVYYGSFTRDLCDKYLTVFADFKYARSFFDSSLAAVPFTPDPFHIPGTPFPTVGPSGPFGISVPIQNPFNPFTVGDTTLVINGAPVPMTTGVRFRGLSDTGPRSEKFTYWDQLFDVGLRGEMGGFGDYFKTWNWETGFRYSRNEGQDLSVGEVSQPGLRDALLDTNPATAFDPFGGFNSTKTLRPRGAGSMLPCITQVSMSCLLVTPRLMATCSIFPPGRSHLPLAASTTRRDSLAIVTHSITRLTPLAQWMGKASV